MAHQIVATSVPRGLDGVSGYQTVLKSAGMPPRVFDRLKARSGYSHRYPHGDSRNPVVYVHRIEELGGNRWHVLGCIRDAGSDHTGRSNFLAHMLAIDAAEARGKMGGPAAAAIARGCFLDKWDRPPEPAAPAKTLVAADRPVQPGDAPAWSAVGLDPGLAGDLAAAAMGNRKVVLVTRPSDDVLSLFADAMRLVEPAKRWAVTFNTCAIEDFDGTWKAVRADLSDAKDLRDGKAALIDLTTNPRGSSDAYARFARGEVDSLPWQNSTTHSELEPQQETTAQGDSTRPDEKRGHKSLKELNAKRTGKVPAGRGVERRAPYEEVASPSPWRTISIVGLSLLLLGGLVAIPFRDRLFGSLRVPERNDVEPETELTNRPVQPPPMDAKDTPEYRAATKLKEARTRLENGVSGKTYDALRDEAVTLQRRIEDLRRGHSGQLALQIMVKEGADRDPIRGVEAVIKVCGNVAEILQTASGLKPEDFDKAESDLAAAVAQLAVLQKQVDALAFAERREAEAKKQAAEADALQRRRQKAFEDLQSIVEAVSLPTASAASGTDIGSPVRATPGVAAKIDLGPFAFADLVDPKFGLAVPRDTIEGGKFKAEIVRVENEDVPRWEIRYVPPAIATDGDKQAGKPRPLVSLIARDGHLFLEVPRSNELGLSPFALLRRSVILVAAKDPAKPDAEAEVRQQIRLVPPMKVRPLVVDLFGEEHQEIKIPSPAGIARLARGPEGHFSLALPIESLRLEMEFPKKESLDLGLPKDVTDPTKPGIGTWPRRLAELGPKLGIQAMIKLSLPQATLTAHTEFVGEEAKLYDKEKVKELFVNQPDQLLKKVRRRFEAMVEKGRDFKLADTETKQARDRVMQWFAQPLATQQKGGLGVPMPGHETVDKSFEIFLIERYDEEKKKMKPDKEPELPATWKAFVDRSRQAKDERDWKSDVTDDITAWADWFVPQLEKQWQESVKIFRGAVDERHEIRINRITSLAYDESGKVYDVPLVVLDEPTTSLTPAETAAPSGLGPAVGLD
jgi:hypothetical protein